MQRSNYTAITGTSFIVDTMGFGLVWSDTLTLTISLYIANEWDKEISIHLIESALKCIIDAPTTIIGLLQSAGCIDHSGIIFSLSLESVSAVYWHPLIRATLSCLKTVASEMFFNMESSSLLRAASLKMALDRINLQRQRSYCWRLLLDGEVCTLLRSFTIASSVLIWSLEK